MSVMTVDPFERERARDAALWTAAALVVAALHVGLAVAYLALRPAPAGQAEAPAISVAFVPASTPPADAAPDAPAAEPTPRVEQSDLPPLSNPPVETREAAVEPEPPPLTTESLPSPEAAPPAVALQVPEPVAEPQPDQVTIMPPPPAKLVDPTPQAKPEKIPEQSPRHPTVDEKAERAKTPNEKHKTAPPRPAAAPSSRPTQLAMAPNRGVDSEGGKAGRASWESEVRARISRHAAYPNGGRDSGTVNVGVTIDRNGRLVSRRLAASSGSAMLDNAAIGAIERAQPFPPFPPGMTQGQIALIVPLHLRPH